MTNQAQEPTGIPRDALAELLSFFDEADVSLENTRVREHPVGCDVLTDVQWFETDDDGPGHTVRHTIAYLHRPDATLPEFEIRPRTGFGTRVLGLLASAVGVPSLELEGESTFQERYWVITMNAESVKVLLGREAIDAILSVDDLVLRFGPRGVMASRISTTDSSTTGFSPTARQVRDHRLDASASRRLLEDAMIANAPIVDDPETSRRAADAVEGSYAEEATRNLQAQGGLAGRGLARTLITAEMLDAVRHAPTPRTDIPAPVVRRAWGGTTFPLLLSAGFGLAFLGFGLSAAATGTSEGWIFAGVGLVATIAWGLILRFRRGRRRLVVHGVPVEGRLTSVERTDTSVNDDPQHRITLETDDGAEPLVITVGSAPAQQARRRMEAGKPTWVLRDPARPGRGLWLEGWCLESALD